MGAGHRGVEGRWARGFTRKRGEAQTKTRRHDKIVKARDLNKLLLRPWQHEIATRSGAAAPVQMAAQPGLVGASGPKSGQQAGCTLIRMSLT